MKELNARKWKRLFEIAQEYYQENGLSHRWDHVIRVERLAERIALEEGANLEVVKVAALLHDIGRKKETETKGKVCHAEYGAKLAERILKKEGFSEEFASRVIKAIKRHRFRGKTPPETLEEKVVFDADKIDSLGAVGIARAFLFAGEIGARLHNSEVLLEETKPYTIEDTAWREYKLKLSKIKDRLLTRTGKKIAKKRTKFMQRFFEELNAEVEGIR